MSKPRNRRVNKKISKLVDEGYPMYQAAAIFEYGRKEKIRTQGWV